MLRAFQEIFVDPVDYSPLTFEGELRDGRWHNGYLHSSRGETWPVREGIPDFLRRKFQGPCGCRSAADLPYEQNWRNGSRVLTEKDSGFAEACREAADCGHPVIDIASGPGGGFMPPLLALNPNAVVMATDTATQVLHGWKEYFDSQGISLPVCFAGFDARKMPIASNSVEVITSAMGFSSVGSVNDILAALREAARVLTDDGIIYAAEARIEQEGMKMLSSKMGWDFEEIFEHRYKMSLPEIFDASGLNLLRKRPYFRRRMRPEDNEYGEAAHKVGVELWVGGDVYWLAKRRLK